ncbi:MAG TPA: sigma-70 family RNA polymerase sigma factor [Gemmataceae bacterium]|nr:sigma-70 family RNA polymerase sigma factor [Gemmataceae bacterium]
MGDDRTELLVRLLTRHQDQLFRYILALVPHVEDARDVLQETSVALYRKFAEYDTGKPFLPWAYLEVLKFRDSGRRRGRALRPEVLEQLARERADHDSVLDARLEALEQCLAELSPEDQRLIRGRYQGGARTDELVRLSGSSRRTMFRNLDRIRRLLCHYIDQRVAAAESAPRPAAPRSTVG